MKDEEIVAKALEMVGKAYAPYSHFRVGAAVKGASGKINLFSDPKTFKVYLRKSPTEFKSYTLEELLPESFGPDQLSYTSL